jgi:hypothetical protein
MNKPVYFIYTLFKTDRKRVYAKASFKKEKCFDLLSIHKIPAIPDELLALVL